jgi:mitosis inhibitor protein kinase SWE1
MRRVLSDSSNQGNITPSASRRNSGDENSSSSEEKSPKREYRIVKTPALLPPRREEPPPTFDFAHTNPNHFATMAEHFTPAKSSPLKRVDGRINLDQPNFGTPAKRRSLHGSSDFDIFSQSVTSFPSEPEVKKPQEMDPSTTPFGSPAIRRVTSTRKSAHQRQTPAPSRNRFSLDFGANENATPMPTMQKTRQRMSLDSSFLLGPQQESPFVKPAMRSSQPPSVVFGQRSALSRSTGIGQPHPLSNALTASSSGSSLTGSSPSQPSFAAPMVPRKYPHSFAKSLPLGIPRPQESFSSQDTQSSFETPDLYKFAKPNPTAFMSTGVISKRNKNMDVSNEPVYQMPDTPSKRASFPPVTGSPFPTSAFKKIGRPKLDFGVSTSHTPAGFPKTRGVMFPSISNTGLSRKTSFVSDDLNGSPTQQQDSQSSADELPPTPTKPAGKKEKENSLRSSLFGRRTSLNPDTFVPPGAADASGSKDGDCKYPSFSSSTISFCQKESECEQYATPPSSQESDSTGSTVTPSHFSATKSSSVSNRTRSRAKKRRVQSPLHQHYNLQGTNGHFATAAAANGLEQDELFFPHTPLDSFTPPDPSRLSISAGQSKWGASLSSSTMSNNSFPPATPTAQRDYQFPFQNVGLPLNVQRVTQNDVDTSLAARFTDVVLYGNGEFSQVFRVEGRIDNPLAPSQSSTPTGVWAVKKAKKPFTGPRDRERKYREVEILKALKGNDHILSFVDDWESKGHLYIQTEFCEDGNLRDFSIRHGAKGRLDDFRIWKILLELSLGVKHIHENGFIHLDLKPANVLIDFEGVLKIADFGLASSWPPPAEHDGEGDREYMAAEILQGRFDKPADVYALGIMILEIAANMELPSYGEGWQRLRHGNLANIPSLTFSSASTLPRTEDGDPISPSKAFGSDDSAPASDDSSFSDLHTSRRQHHLHSQQPPNFMVDPEDERSLESVVVLMMQEHPECRPTIEEVYRFPGVQWVERRRRAGATVYEGVFGPGEEVLGVESGIEGVMGDGDVDMMDV